MHDLQIYAVYEWHADPWYFPETCSTTFEKRMRSLDFVINGIRSVGRGSREEKDPQSRKQLLDIW